MTTYFQLDDHFLTYDGNEVIADYTLKETDLRTPKSFFYKKFQKSELTHEEKKKLKVMVKIFGRKNLLELSYMQVEKEG